MRYPAVKSIVPSSLIIGLLFASFPVQATVYDVSGIPKKNTGDAITASEVNLVVDMLRNFKKDDRGDLDVSNDRLGIGIAGTPGYLLDVNGTINAAAFRGDGSQLTNLPNPGVWKITANDIYYNTGKVAIGINSSPTYQLEVHATGDSAVQVNAGGSGNDATLRLKNDSQEWIIRNNGGAGDNFQINNVTTGTNVVNIDASSNQTTLANKLTVNNDITSTGVIYATEFYDSDAGVPLGAGTGLWEEGAEGSEIYYNVDNVGIGTANPAYPLQVEGDTKLNDHLAVGAGATINTDRVAYIDEDFSTDLNNYLLMVQGTASGSTTGTKTFRGGYIDAETLQTESSGNAYTEGLYSRARSNGSATFNTLRGVNGVAFNDSRAATGIGNLIGVSGESYNHDTVGTVPAAYGGYFTSRGRTALPAGNITNLYGIRSEAAAYEASVTNAYGAYNYVRTVNGDTGDITNAYGSYNQVRVDSAAGGDITNAYGVYSLLDGRAGSTEFTTASGIYSDVNNANTAYAGRFYADDPTANLNYGIVVGASGATNNYGIYGTDGDWVLDADGNGVLGGTGSNLIIGEDADLRIYHNGSDSVIDNRTGDLVLLNSGSGNVGIGTSSPDSPLYVDLGSSYLRATPGASGTTPALQLGTDNPSAKALSFLVGTTASAFNFDQTGNFLIQSAPKSSIVDPNSNGSGTVRFTIRGSDGGVGIGDSTPDGTLKLDVEGQIGATEYCDANGANCTLAADLGGGLWTASAGGDVYYNSGNVGIGVTNPNAMLAVGTTATPNFAQAIFDRGIEAHSSGDAVIDITSVDTGGVTWRIQQITSGSVDGNLNFVDRTNGVTPLTLVKASGNIGIGTTSPAEELYVTKTQTEPTSFVVQNSSALSGANVRAGVSVVSNGAQLDLMTYGTGATGTLAGESKSDAAYLRTTTAAPVSSLNIGNGGSAPINFFTGDTKRVTIGNDGKFGIGTPSPTSSLTILNTSDDNGFNMETVNGRFYQSYASNQNRILVGEKNGGSGSAGIYLNGNDGDLSGSDYAALVHSGTTGDLTLTTTSNSGTWTAADIILAPAGNVGIGTTAPSAGLKLDVAGKVGATEYCDANGANCTLASALGSGYWSKTGDDVWYNPGVTGEVGIGLSNPSEELVVNRSANNAPTTIAVQNSNTGNGTNTRAGFTASSNGAQIDVMTYSSAATGAIGGVNKADGAFIRTGTTLAPASLNVGTGSAVPLNLFTSDVTRMTVAANGNVGIGTTAPGAKLHVRGGSILNNDDLNVNGDNFIVDTATKNQLLYAYGVRRSGTTVSGLTMGGGGYFSGNVGIGTTAPLQKLDITGNLRLTGAIRSNATAMNFLTDTGSALGAKVGSLAITSSYSNNAPTNGLYVQGNVGIGTSTPSEELHVFNNQANPTTIVSGNPSTSNNTNTRAGFTAAANGGQLDIYHLSSAATGSVGDQTKADAAVIKTLTGSPSSKMIIGTGGAVPINLMTNDLTRLTVAGNGNVGIGTTAPGAKLHVRGGSILNNDDLNVNGDNFIVDTATKNQLLYAYGVRRSGTTVSGLTMGGGGYFSGNVGIGTSNPGSKLEIVSGAERFEVGGYTGGASMRYNVDTTGGWSRALGFFSNSGIRGHLGAYGSNNTLNYLYLDARGDGSPYIGSQFILRPTGNVGIGTTTPSEELHVFNSQANPTTIVAGNTSASTNTNTRAGFNAAANGGQLEMYHFSSVATGTQAGVSKADAAFIRTASGAPSSSLNIGNGANAPLNLFTTDAVRMTVEGGGDVGIGLTNPSEKLEVAGTVRASAFVQSSDERLKQNIITIKDPMSVMGIRGVTFDWKADGKADYGFIAQEIEALYPELVTTNPETNLKAVNYSGMTPILLEALKAQQAQIEALVLRLEKLESSSK